MHLELDATRLHKRFRLAASRICITFPTAIPGSDWPVRGEKCPQDAVALGSQRNTIVDHKIDGKRDLLVEEMLRYFGETCPALAARCEVATRRSLDEK